MNMNTDLTKFTEAHKKTYQTALKEIQSGKKMTHWMWYIFPQVYGLGKSSTAQYYAIRSLSEAKAFLCDSYLGGNLIEISQELLKLRTDNPTEIFGAPDDIKLRSSMTLFAFISGDDSVFHHVLKKYFCGYWDEKTLDLLGN